MGRFVDVVNAAAFRKVFVLDGISRQTGIFDDMGGSCEQRPSRRRERPFPPSRRRNGVICSWGRLDNYTTLGGAGAA